jgi:hypothetical protein
MSFLGVKYLKTTFYGVYDVFLILYACIYVFYLGPWQVNFYEYNNLAIEFAVIWTFSCYKFAMPFFGCNYSYLVSNIKLSLKNDIKVI